MSQRIKDIITVIGIQDKNAEFLAEFMVAECLGIIMRNSHRDDDMAAIIANQIRRELLEKG